MDNIYQAVEVASPIWQQAVFRLSWWHGLVAVAYGVAAWLCFLNARATREAQGSCAMWCVAAALLCLMGANVMLQGDVFVTQMCRALARLQGWYGQRRELQYLALGLVALAVLGLGLRAFQRFKPHAQSHTDAASAALLALLVLLALRTVSAHGTDAMVNARFFGLSVGRLFELAGIAWVTLSALRNLRQPSTNPESYPSGTGRHV